MFDPVEGELRTRSPLTRDLIVGCRTAVGAICPCRAGATGWLTLFPVLPFPPMPTATTQPMVPSGRATLTQPLLRLSTVTLVPCTMTVCTVLFFVGRVRTFSEATVTIDDGPVGSF